MYVTAHDAKCPRLSERGGTMEHNHVIAVAFVVGVMNHEPSSVKRLEDTSSNFGGRTNKGEGLICLT